MSEQQTTGWISFYRHEQQTRPLKRLGSWLLSLFSPRFGHVAIEVDDYLFHYGKDGYEARPKAAATKQPTESVAVKLDKQVLLRWDKPQRLPRWVRLVMLPFKNCSTEAAAAAGVKAPTPDALYLKLSEINQ
jgi:hypothetical protein